MFGSATSSDGRPTTTTLLQIAAINDHLEMVMELLNIYGGTALMYAADLGHEACVKALLRAKANTELLDKDGRTALQWSEAKGHKATAQLIRQHAAPP